MLEYVKRVEDVSSTDGNADNELITISRKELDRIKREREEYRAICLDFAEVVKGIKASQGGVIE